MGQTKSKLNPIISHPPASTAETSPVEEISTPAPPRHITRLSELIDFNDLFEVESLTPDSPNSPDSPTSPTPLISPAQTASPNSAHFPDSPGSPSSISPLTTRRSKQAMVQSPSGNILSAQEFLQRPDRKLTLEERKHSIRINTETQIQKEEDSGGNGRKGQRKKARRGCLGLCGI